LVHWKGKTTEEATWEDEITLRSQFPGLRLKDKSIFQDEVIDRAQRVNGPNEPLAHEVKYGSRWGSVYVRKKSRGNDVI